MSLVQIIVFFTCGREDKSGGVAEGTAALPAEVDGRFEVHGHPVASDDELGQDEVQEDQVEGAL